MAVAPGYTTRRRVKEALDVASSARMDAQIDAGIESASRFIDESLCNRYFYPWTGTLTWDYPGTTSAPSYRLWLDDHGLISLSAASSGPTTLDPTKILLRPDWGPPFTYCELPRDTVGGWNTGATPQRAISLTGVYGYDLTEAASGSLTAGCTATSPTLAVSDASVIGPGSLLRLGTERVICTGASMAPTGLTLAGTGLAATAAATALTASGTGLVPGEIILVDSERMLVTDAIGTAVTVRRAWDGSVLAAHANGAAINAARTLTVLRGAVGTTAVVHNSGDPIVRHVFPGPVVNLTVAIALGEVDLETRGYSTVGLRSGKPQQTASLDIANLTDRVYSAYGRKNRKRAV